MTVLSNAESLEEFKHRLYSLTEKIDKIDKKTINLEAQNKCMSNQELSAN